MISSLELLNFKSFKNKKLPLGKLTVLSGLNNSGKSRVIQAVRMCAADMTHTGPHIDGHGGYSELKSRLTEVGAPIFIELAKSEADKATLILTEKGFDFSHSYEIPYLQFISADRFGPKVQLPIIGDDISALRVGAHGEFSAHYAVLFENCIIAERLRHPSSASNTLKHQLNWWMGEISPGVKLDFEVVNKYDSSHLAVDGHRPTNSGFGISYVLPIVLSLLSMSSSIGKDEQDWRIGNWFTQLEQKKGILLIENPEAHLHPRGQTLLGQLIARAASLGVQIIVETHSDHFLDGVRLAVKNEEYIDPHDIAIKYFKKNPEEETEVLDITVFKNGKLDYWPEGFFDQTSLNLRALAK